MKSLIKVFIKKIVHLEYADSHLKIVLNRLNWCVVELNLSTWWFHKYRRELSGYDNIFIFNSNIGEAYVVFKYFLPAIIDNCNGSILLVLTKKSHLQLFKLFAVPCSYCLIESGLIDKLPSAFCINKQKFKVFFNQEYFLKFENIVKSGGGNYFRQISQQLELEPCCKEKWLTLAINETEENNLLKKLNKIGLEKGKYVFILPEANTCEDMTFTELSYLVNTFKQKGYSPLVNIVKRMDFYSIEGIKTCDLSLEECIYVAKNAYLVIGVKSGLFELLAETGVKCIVIAKQFRYNKEISAEKCLRGFSAKYLPQDYLIEEYSCINHIKVKDM